jgi:hypothetical protein
MTMFAWVYDGYFYGVGMTAEEATFMGHAHLKANGELFTRALMKDENAVYPPESFEYAKKLGVLYEYKSTPEAEISLLAMFNPEAAQRAVNAIQQAQQPVTPAPVAEPTPPTANGAAEMTVVEGGAA